MEERQLRIGFVVLLIAATAYVFWFDWAALAALLHPTTDRAGHTQFQVPGYANTVYPFTYAAVLASVLGVAFYVAQAEKHSLRLRYAVLLGLLVGNLASVGMIDAYEQVYVVLSHYWYWVGVYWGTPGGLAGTVGGILIVLAILPWAKRTNLPGVLLWLAIYAVSTAVWVSQGFVSPPSGSAVDLAMNATSRIASQLALVAAVATEDWVALLRRWVRRAWRLLRPTPTAA